jgi:hypothetical protein
MACGRLAASPPAPEVQLLFQGKWPSDAHIFAYDVKIAGNYAYVACGVGGLVVLDVKNPDAPSWIGGYNLNPAHPEGESLENGRNPGFHPKLLAAVDHFAWARLQASSGFSF